MSAALQLAAGQNWDGAKAAAQPAGPVWRDVIEWMRLRAGQGAAADYPAFLKRHPDWPGLTYLSRKGERAVAASGDAAAIRAYFAARPPQTAAGSLACQAALIASGKTTKARDEARRAWLDLSYSAGEQNAELASFGKALIKYHQARLTHLLWSGRLAEARRMLPLVGTGARRLAEARIRLQANEVGVDAAVAAVPKAEAGDAGLAFDRFVWRYDKGFYDSAADLLLERSSSVHALGRPEDWARRRAKLARREMRQGDPHRAYRIAANHHLKDGSAHADLEFLAGYIALAKLNKPKLALRHFKALRAAVSTPISLSRAAYWQARALAKMGDATKARAAYEMAAQNQTAFYGQLAAEALGQPLDPALLGHEHYSDWRREGFLKSSALHAGLLLAQAGDLQLATLFFLHVAGGLKPAQSGPLADLALSIHEPYIAVKIAKQAARRGLILPRAYFPVTDLSKAKLPVSPALALAIARRESEFDEGIVSPAGARGLMQVMPATARLMSDKVGLDYDKARLTQDGTYNAKLGAAYLAQMIEEFGPAVTLVAAGYNAGPNRPRAWILGLGDPRALGVDPVDWIESVPLSETRNYIMRVAESLTIYQAKMAGKSGAIHLIGALKGK